jgi:hypothetical protein
MSNEREEQISKRLQTIAKAIKYALPPGHGFILCTFEFGPESMLQYVSNGRREDIAQVMREFIATITDKNYGTDVPDTENRCRTDFADWWTRQVSRDPNADLESWCFDAYVAGRTGI